jgi:hypothetical protein
MQDAHQFQNYVTFLKISPSICKVKLQLHELREKKFQIIQISNSSIQDKLKKSVLLKCGNRLHVVRRHVGEPADPCYTF